MPRELSKCRKWEKDRRNRLNECFKKLEEVLPCYDPSVNLSKPDILGKAVLYINELKEKVKNFLTADPEKKPEHEEIKQLYSRVKQLLTRNDQLSRLLKDAGISIPSECGNIKLFKGKMWSQVISPQKAAMMAKLEEQKENEPRKIKKKCIQKKKLVQKKQFLKQKIKKSPKKGNSAGPKNSRQVVISGTNFNPVQNLVTVANVQPCFFIANNIPNTLAKSGVTNPATTVLSNSNVLTTPILSTAAKTPIVFSKPTTFPTGTIIFTNNLPVIQPPTLINPPIILNAPPTNTVILVNKPNQNNSQSIKKLETTTTPSKSTSIAAKPVQTLCVKVNNTKTTHVNKVPIPASRYASNYILVSKVPINKSVNIKKCQKVVKKVNKEAKTKRKIDDKVASAEAKKSKKDIEIQKVEIVESETKKIGSSDYSIDAICKDKPEETPAPEENAVVESEKAVSANLQVEKTPELENKVEKKIEGQTEEPEKEKSNKPIEAIPDNLVHSELSNDIFASLQVPTGGQNPESTSPTAAFLNAFPLVSSFTGVKVAEVMEEETSDSQHGTPTLLQIGTMDSTKPTQSITDTLTPSLLNLDNFSFFSSKELYNAFDAVVTSTNTSSKVSTCKEINVITKTAKILYDTAVSETVCIKPNQIIAKVATPTTTSSVISNNTIPVITNNMASSSTAIIPQKLVTTVTTQTTSTITYSIPNTYAQPFYNNNNTQVVSSVSQISTNVNYVANKTKQDKSACSRYTSYNISEYNTFNPFTDLPKTSAVCTYTTTKTYTQPTYTNNTNCNYNYQTDFNTNYPVKNISKPEKYYNMNYENYDNTNQYNYYNPQLKSNVAAKVKPNDVAPRPPVNWMTTPDLKQQATDFVVPTFGKESEFVANIYTQNNFVSNSQTTYFNATAPIYSSTEFHNSFEGKKLDSQFNNGFQRNDVEEHQFSWSPTKLPQLLDPSHTFVATTLPTLVGDLALGNTQYQDKNKMKKDRRTQQNFDAASNFLSVSQLVDHSKTDGAARINSRRNSGGRSKATPPKNSKRSNKPENKEAVMSSNFKPVEKTAFNNQNNQTGEWMADAKRIKQPPSSYSAEALIGHPPQPQNQTKQRAQQNYSKTLPVPTFFSENMLYFPPVDIQQENNFSQQNQNYQNNTFTPSFPSSNTYSATYLPTTNFIPEITDYNPVIPDNIFSHSNTTKIPENKQFNKTQNKPPANKPIFNNTTPKKSKKKANVETSTPGFVDFSFLSMPGAINSPILPDDFHAHSNFLPPPNPNQLYPCKNPLYPKQGTELSGGLLPLPPVSRSNIQHAEISPSLNTVGTSLTNFNLSTIFPEINKSTVPDMYLDPIKNKDYGLQRSYLPTSTQIPSFSKTPIYSTITTQSFPNS